MRIMSDKSDDQPEFADASAGDRSVDMSGPDGADAGTVCPKRAWTLSVLSDDPAPGPALPRGLGFHLKRCPSCQAVAERLAAVRTQLAALSAGEDGPGGGGAAGLEQLLRRANQQVMAALEAGAAPQRSAPWPDDLLLLAVQSRQRRTRWMLRSAVAAAALAFAVSAGRWWTPRDASSAAMVRQHSPGQSGAPERHASSAAPGSDDEQARDPGASAGPGGLADAPGERLAKGGGPGRPGAAASPDRAASPAVQSFQRAFVPGRDYAAIIGSTIDTAPPRGSNRSLGDEP